jgi:hypothetical protein
MVELSSHNYQTEFEDLFTIDLTLYAQYLTNAVVNQFYQPMTTLISVAVAPDNSIIGFTWAHIGNRNYWSNDSLLIADMIHLNLDLSPRLRIKLITDIFKIWDEYAILANAKVICSNSIREDQTAFMQLHRRAGYTIKGSYAYKKVSAEQTGLPIP